MTAPSDAPRHPATVDLDQYRETMRWIEQSQIPGTPEWCDNEEMSANEPETITREIRASLTCSIAAMSPEAKAAVDAQLETYGRPDVVLSADDCIELMLVHGCLARDQQTPKQASAYK